MVFYELPRSVLMGYCAASRAHSPAPAARRFLKATVPGRFLII
jgi:hypothetical protein